MQKVVYQFAGFGAGVTSVAQSAVVDVVGVGLADGRIIVHNLKQDKTVFAFTQTEGAVTTMAFRSGTCMPPLGLAVTNQAVSLTTSYYRQTAIVVHRNTTRTDSAVGLDQEEIAQCVQCSQQWARGTHCLHARRTRPHLYWC